MKIMYMVTHDMNTKEELIQINKTKLQVLQKITFLLRRTGCFAEISLMLIFRIHLRRDICKI